MPYYDTYDTNNDTDNDTDNDTEQPPQVWNYRLV